MEHWEGTWSILYREGCSIERLGWSIGVHGPARGGAWELK